MAPCVSSCHVAGIKMADRTKVAHSSEDFGPSGTHLRLGGVLGGGSLW